jgi:hypothetical protein
LGIVLFLVVGLWSLRMYFKSMSNSFVTRTNLLIGGLGAIAVAIWALFRKCSG